MARILLVEDDQSLATGLEYNLIRAGYEVEIAADGVTAIARAVAAPPDLMILDLMLPRKSGFDVLEELAERTARIPIVILSAKDEEVDKIRGFDLGAVDYVTKPFSLGELMARIKVRLSERKPPGERFRVAVGIVDLARHQLETGDEVVTLTQTEVAILRKLRAEKGRLVTRDDLLRSIWNLGPRSTRALDTHIARLRKKLESDPGDPQHLRTVHGVGYRLVEN